MSTQGEAGAKGRNWVIVSLGGVGLTLLAFVAVLVILLREDRDFKFSMDGAGKLTVSAEGAPLSEVIEQAMAEHPDTVVDALRRLDGKAEEHSALTAGIRDILWKTEGPFSPPGVFAGAGHLLYERGVLELNSKLGDFSPDDPEAAANAFVTRMVVDQLDREGLFKDRLFRGKVVRLEGVPHRKDGDLHVVYVCADSELGDRKLILMPNDPGVPRHMRAINAIARVDPVRFDDCDEPPQTMQRYLARQAAHIGLAAEGFASFAYGEIPEDGIAHHDVAAKFQVIPKYHIFQPIQEVAAKEESR